MAGTNDHIIQKQTLHFLVFGKEYGFRFQKELSKKFWEEIRPAMEAVFDEMVGAYQVVQIEKLELDLGEIKKSELKEALIRKLKETLKDALKGNPTTPSAKVSIMKSALPVSRFQKWLHFLEHGHFQWTEVEGTNEAFYRDIYQTLASDALAVEEFRKLLSENHWALERLVRQHETERLKTLAEACAGRRLDDLVESWVELKRLTQDSEGRGRALRSEKDPFNNQVLDQLFWKQVFRKLVIQNKSISSVPQWLGGLLQTMFPPLSLLPLLAGWKQQLRLKKDTYPLISPVINQLIKKFPNTPDTKPESVKKEADKPDTTIAESDIKDLGAEDINRLDQEKSANSREKNEQDIQKEEQAAASQDKDTSGPVAKDKRLGQQAYKSDGKLDREEPLGEEARHNPTWDSFEGKRNIDQHIESTEAPAPVIHDNIPTNQEYAEGTESYIKEAGMVLLHPFLSTFYNTCDLLEGKNFKNEAARGRAVLLLQYLATGETELPEYKLLLPKLLCELPLELPVEKHLELSVQETEEGHNLLKALIKHWGALGNSSPDALREGFILRDGKLSKRSNGWYLQVEQKTIDILLDRLPWNLSMIKLPWMKDILRVEWV